MAQHVRVARARHGDGISSQAASRPRAVKALDPAAPDLEGYLFPETYNLARARRGRDAGAQMVAALSARSSTEPLRRKREAQGRTLREVVTLASLVEKETAQPRSGRWSPPCI